MAGVPLLCGKTFPAVLEKGRILVLHLCAGCWLCSRVTSEGGHCQVAQGLFYSGIGIISQIPAALFCSHQPRLGSDELSCLSFGCTGQGVVPDFGGQDSPCPWHRGLMSPCGGSAVPCLGAEPPPCRCSLLRAKKY